jgi:hypothetical protein
MIRSKIIATAGDSVHSAGPDRSEVVTAKIRKKEGFGPLFLFAVRKNFDILKG